MLDDKARQEIVQEAKERKERIRRNREIKRQREANRLKREMSKKRIPNIPDFYERLNSICDKKGKIIVDDNHPVLQTLRVAVGGKRYVNEFREKLINKRKEKGLSQQEAADLAGVELYALRNYEYRGVKSKTDVYQKIIDSPLFD